MTLERSALAAMIASHIPAGSFVNLGIGAPTLIADHLDSEQGVTLHSENGLLGMGPTAVGDDVDPDLINAGKIPVSLLPGSAFFDHTESFAMIRGGHLDVCVLGAFQVSVHGDLANWHAGSPDAIPAVGGAMDLAVGAREVWVIMDLLTKAGRSKLVEECTYPLTAVGCVSRVYTDHALFSVGPQGAVVVDRFGVSLDELRRLTGLDLAESR
jgi:3-oxoadipate CoA-transferase beta subunit